MEKIQNRRILSKSTLVNSKTLQRKSKLQAINRILDRRYKVQQSWDNLFYMNSNKLQCFQVFLHKFHIRVIFSCTGNFGICRLLQRYNRSCNHFFLKIFLLLSMPFYGQHQEMLATELFVPFFSTTTDILVQDIRMDAHNIYRCAVTNRPDLKSRASK